MFLISLDIKYARTRIYISVSHSIDSVCQQNFKMSNICIFNTFMFMLETSIIRL